MNLNKLSFRLVAMQGAVCPLHPRPAFLKKAGEKHFRGLILRCCQLYSTVRVSVANTVCLRGDFFVKKAYFVAYVTHKPLRYG